MKGMLNMSVEELRKMYLIDSWLPGNSLDPIRDWVAKIQDTVEYKRLLELKRQIHFYPELDSYKFDIIKSLCASGTRVDYVVEDSNVVINKLKEEKLFLEDMFKNYRDYLINL